MNYLRISLFFDFILPSRTFFSAHLLSAVICYLFSCELCYRIWTCQALLLTGFHHYGLLTFCLVFDKVRISCLHLMGVRHLLHFELSNLLLFRLVFSNEYFFPFLLPARSKVWVCRESHNLCQTSWFTLPIFLRLDKFPWKTLNHLVKVKQKILLSFQFSQFFHIYGYISQHWTDINNEQHC